MPQAPAPTSSDLIAEAVAILRRGGVVAFPTETVYGLGADASNETAVAKVYAIKGRPSAHPLIVHIGNPAHLLLWARDIPESARKLAERFWPGPLTLVLKRSPTVTDAVTGGQDTIGLRIPGHPVALALLRAFGGGIAAPSANKFGRVSPTTAEHVRRDLGDEVDLILDGGSCEIGIESTIVDLSRGRPVLLRPGAIRPAEIAAAIGLVPEPRDAGSPRASGTLESHYAPRKPMRLVGRDELLRAVERRGADYAVFARSEAPPGVPTALWIRAPQDAERYAHELYANLRLLDASAGTVILVERVPQDPAWAAVNDRLGRAAAG